MFDRVSTTARSSFIRRVAGPLAMLALLAMPLAFAQGGDLTKSPPPAPYVNASTLLPLPDFIPGAGALFIDPANAPTGPWLAYGNDGSLVEVLFMIPVADFDASKNWSDLGKGLLAQIGLTVDHVNITYNGGHPGMAEPHYHIRLAFVDAAKQEKLLAQ